jgi:hypothetical protein
MADTGSASLNPRITRGPEHHAKNSAAASLNTYRRNDVTTPNAREPRRVRIALFAGYDALSDARRYAQPQPNLHTVCIKQPEVGNTTLFAPNAFFAK